MTTLAIKLTKLYNHKIRARGYTTHADTKNPNHCYIKARKPNQSQQRSTFIWFITQELNQGHITIDQYDKLKTITINLNDPDLTTKILEAMP